MDLPKHIVVATDFTPASERALEYAVDLARNTGADVTLVHACETAPIDALEGALSDPGAVVTRKITAARQALDAAAARHGEVPIATRLVDEPPWEAVEHVADEVHADLIVVGTHAHRGLSRLLHRGVAENIVRRSQCPVLTLH